MEVKQTKKKLIFTDLDETLLKENKYYFKPLHCFIIKLLKHEYTIIPVTSKTYSEVVSILKATKFKIPFSVENGAAYYIPIENSKYILHKKVLNPNAINKVTIKKILYKTTLKKYLHNIEFIENLSFLRQKNITKLNYNQLENFNLRDYTISILWHGDKYSKKNFETSLLKYNLKITFGGRLYNISGLHSKVDAMSFFTKHYKKIFKRSKIITISLGDSQNDIEITNLKKKNNLFRSFTKAPYGWVELLKKIIVKMEKDNN